MALHRWLALVFLPLFLLLLSSGCMAKKAYDVAPAYPSESYSYAEEAEAMDYSGMAESSRAMSRAAGGMAAPPPPPAPAVVSQPTSSADTSTSTSTQNTATPPATAERMVHYNGYLNLRVTDPTETTRTVAELARARGGYVETLTDTHVTIRVPVKDFEAAFDALLALGDVIDRNVSAEDVTEAFTAVDLRLKTLKATRDRLVELLARATDEQEKLALLRQIQRVSEEIDVVEGQLRTLAELANFSRITVQATPRSAFTDRPATADAAGLGWIQSLTPFTRSIGYDDKRIPLDAPEGMVVLAPRGRFIAESADGAVLWTERLPNEPQGDAGFWVSAIQQRLAGEFGQAERVTLGGFEMLRLVEENDGYRYLIGVRTDGRWLEVVQVYYPSAEQEARYGEKVLAAVRGGAS